MVARARVDEHVRILGSLPDALASIIAGHEVVEKQRVPVVRDSLALPIGIQYREPMVARQAGIIQKLKQLSGGLNSYT